ncbi:MAG: GerMN domain-containing protein [Treponema sp.]|nr:GerMN domain-containing protein [Treponema sp.]
MTQISGKVSKDLKKTLSFLALGLVFAAFAVSLVRFALGRTGERRIFYFQSLDDGHVCTEIRFLSPDAVQGSVAFFVDELLLGPMTNRYSRLFTPGTVAEFCIVQDNMLHVGLSADALRRAVDTSPLKTGVELLRRNVLANFSGIRGVFVYIDGKQAW